MRPLALALIACTLAACPGKRAPARERTLFFRGEPAAQVEERIEDEGGGKRVVRRVRLPNGETAETSALLDASGFVTHARYRRADRRAVDLAVDGATGSLTDGAASITIASPVVAIELMRHVNPAVPTVVTLVDLASGEAMPGRVERRGASVSVLDAKGGLIARCNVEGACTGPGAFFEGEPADAPALDTAPVDVPLVATGPRRGLRLVGIDDARGALELDGPGQRTEAPGVVAFIDPPKDVAAPNADDRAPGLFIESNDPAVKAFALEHGSGVDVLGDAVSIANAVFPIVNPAATDAPPSAKEMLARGGDCDGAAALVTAAMRALGHAAHPVVGYRFVDGRYVPHAWAEVYTPTGWVLIDASVPKVGSASALGAGGSVSAQHLKLFRGLGSALTMGRVLGRLRVEPAAPRPPVTP